jgi:hypothetical protein
VRSSQRSSLSASITLLTLLGFASPASARAADTTPPEVQSISFSRDSVAVSGTQVKLLTVSVHLTDDVGVVEGSLPDGLTHPYIVLNVPDGYAALELGTGTPQDGVWTTVLAVTSDWPATVEPTHLVAADEARNELDVDPRTVVDTPELTVRSTGQPVLTMSFSPDPAPPNSTVTQTIRATNRTTGQPWPELGIAVAIDNACVEGLADRPTGYTNQNGIFQRTLPGNQYVDFLMCAWVTAPNVPGRTPTRIGAIRGMIRYQFVVSAAPASPSVPAGTNVAVTGNVWPVTPGHTVLLQRRYATEWRTVNTGVTRTSSRYTVVATPPGVGTWSYRVVAPAGENRAGGVSPAFTIRGT